MKKVIVFFVLVFLAGFLSGGVYEWYSAQKAQLSEADSIVEPAEEKEEKKEEAPAPAQTVSEPENNAAANVDNQEHRVTNPDKICSTPGCDRAVFVTYKGKELCVTCYAKAKNRDAQND